MSAVAGSANDPKLYYIGTAGGGAWKSSDGGATWTDVFAKEPVGSIGAIAIDPKNDQTIWVGTGETNPRNDVTYGDGIYKSVDGGKTWANVGLAATRYISSIAVDPRDSNVVIVGALGDYYADSTERGIYRTTDGGKTWQKTLYVGPQSGVSDLTMDPNDPNVLYAGVWKFRRKPWTFTSGGPQDGLYKSSDGGRTWTKLSGGGLPTGTIGRIGVAVAPSDSKRVYATIESTQGSIWRSDDGGAYWTMVNARRGTNNRPFYFSHIAVDPKNRDRVYAVSKTILASDDAGKTFKRIARDTHVDFHGLWIAPNDPKRMIAADDGGYALTLDGDHWAFAQNFAIGQVYHVGFALHQNPYTICAGFQDNGEWCGPSDSLASDGITNRNWQLVGGSDGMTAIPDPLDPQIVWAVSQIGALALTDLRTQTSRDSFPYIQDSQEQYDLASSRYRFNWDSPLAFAPSNPRIAWLGGNVIFQTVDRGRHWTPLTGDLTRNDKAHQHPVGGPVTKDLSGAEFYDTILDIEAFSPQVASDLRGPRGLKRHSGASAYAPPRAKHAGPPARDEIWVGTDDGLVQLLRDGGMHWRDVTPRGLRTAPGDAGIGRFQTVAPSPFDAGTAYAAFDRHELGDTAPHLFVTRDYGRSWQTITNGLPPDQFVRTVRPDDRDPRVLYAGTEQGIWITYDRGAHWQSLQMNMPAVSVRDIRIQPEFDDLIVGTHGRSVYVFDALQPIRRLPEARARGTMLFAPRTAYLYSGRLAAGDGGTTYAADNPPNGAIIDFYQTAPQPRPPTIAIYDRSGHRVRTLSKNVPNGAGLNRTQWDLATDGPVRWKNAHPFVDAPLEGPPVVPGVYTVRMRLGNRVYSQPVTVEGDPVTHLTQAQYAAADAFNRRIFAQISTIDTALNNLDALQRALTADVAAANAKRDATLAQRLAEVESRRAALSGEFAANFSDTENGAGRPGKLLEDVEAAYLGDIPVPLALIDYAHRIDRVYAQRFSEYGTLAQSLDALDTALQGAALKPLRLARVAPPR